MDKSDLDRVVNDEKTLGKVWNAKKKKTKRRQTNLWREKGIVY